MPKLGLVPVLLLVAASVVLALGAWALIAGRRGASGGEDLAVNASPGPQRAFAGAPGPWLNSPPLRPEDLRGKVVLVNFWTYTCINSARPLPYIRAWAEKYKDRGLVVIGVHTPEFAFEKDLANVRQATAEAGVGYPVVLDNDYGIWRAFSNDAWPALYFIDAKGRVRHQMVGEGDYDKSERMLQTLLGEATGSPVTDPIVPINGVGPQAAPDLPHLASPETYLGYERAGSFASPGGFKRDAENAYAIPAALPLNRWALGGAWSAGKEYATLDRAPGRIAYRFRARDLHLIMTPGAQGGPVRFRITIDGQPPGASHGVDTDAAGSGTVREPRMYQLVRQTGEIRDRTFEIEFLDPGLRAYDFTFG